MDGDLIFRFLNRLRDIGKGGDGGNERSTFAGSFSRTRHIFFTSISLTSFPSLNPILILFVRNSGLLKHSFISLYTPLSSLVFFFFLPFYIIILSLNPLPFIFYSLYSNSNLSLSRYPRFNLLFSLPLFPNPPIIIIILPSSFSFFYKALASFALIFYEICFSLAQRRSTWTLMRKSISSKI